MSTDSSPIIEFQCPGCAKKLKAGAAFAGRKVKCPKCSAPVQVPELAPEQLPPPIDLPDDWLGMEMKLQSENPTKRASPPTKSLRERIEKKVDKPDSTHQAVAANSNTSQSSSSDSSNASSSKPESSSHERRSLFDDDLPDLAAQEHTSAKPHNVTDIFQLEGLDDLVKKVPRPSMPPARTQMTGKTPPVIPVEDYRVICRTCGTAQYLKLDRVGKKVDCPDCHSSFIVPPPPPGWSPTKKKAEPHDDGVDVGLAPAEVAQSANTLDSERNSATEYLEKAKQSLEDDEIDDLYSGDFDSAGFFQRTFGFLKDPSAVAQMVVYGFMFAGLFALIQVSKSKADGGGWEGGGYLLILFIFCSVCGTLVTLPLLSSALALLEAVANGQRRVAEWPSFNVFDNMGEILAILVALVGSLLPGMFVGGLISRSGGVDWLVLTGMMGTCFLLFPVLMLSILDNGSFLQPASAAVIKSITQVPEAWGGYYLKTLAGFGVVTVAWFVLLGSNPVMAGIGGAMVPSLLFYVCQQMGALADAISEHLSIDFTPPSREDKRPADEAETES